MREEAVERPGRFSGFLGGVRLIFDACLFALVLLIIGFLAYLPYSKHLHIVMAPINVAASRRPRAPHAPA